MALASMLSREPLQGAVLPSSDLHHPPRAKRVIQLFMAGAASHLDMFDFKPELVKRHGEKSDFGEHVEAFQNGLGPWMKSPFEFKRHGNCGKLMSEIVEPLGEVVDDITCIAVDVHARKTAAAQMTAWPLATPPPSPSRLRPAADGPRETCAIT